MEIIKMPIGDIKPYPNNPRKNDDAVAAVMESIKQCGYCAPIVVDEDGVVLADYQGIGIGTRFLNAVSGMYVAQGYDFSIVTSAKNMIAALHKSDKWVLVKYGISPQSTRPGSRDFCRASLRQNVKTARFF